MAEQEFIKAGYTVVGTENNENKLLSFLKEHYPSVIKDNEIDLQELKTVLGLPIDEKVNGYGLNFVGRNFARAKYAQKTEKELRLNNTLSKNIDTTGNLVLKGDNLDSLKILKSHYSGKIKCIYIDPPYNTTNDEFVYPDRFDKEEAEVLGLANLSDNDFARMDFSFKTKKSHNGWLAFMYPRLLLARDLLSKEGVIFISIDDNEQANLKLLCDDVFGEENFVANIIWQRAYAPVNMNKYFSVSHDYIVCISKNINDYKLIKLPRTEKQNKDYKNIDNDPRGPWKSGNPSVGPAVEKNIYEIILPSGRKVFPPKGRSWLYTKDKYEELIKDNRIYFGKDGNSIWAPKLFLSEVSDGVTPMTLWDYQQVGHSQDATKELKSLFDDNDLFDYPKPLTLIKRLVSLVASGNDIVLDFFAGSGTTGHAVIQQNADDGGNRKFVLCQIDEPIDPAKKKEAYDFCIANNLEPVISSLTIERLKRAGEKIAKEIEEENSKTGLFEEDKKQVPDIGFKVFDSVEAPKLNVDETGQIQFPELASDALSRIYNMIFTIGLDEPTQVPEEVIKDSIYKIGNHYYITNSEKITSDDYSNAIKNGKVFIDGWTASLNGTLQNYKEDVKIVF